MGKIELEIKIDKKIYVDVRIDELIDGINECEMPRRWNYTGQLLNGIDLSKDKLTIEQQEILKKYFSNKLTLFQNL